MNALLKWKKATPIAIEHTRNPFFSFQQEIDKVTASFKKAMLWVPFPKKLESKKNAREIKVEQV